MKSFNEFVNSRKNINLFFKIKNTISFSLIVILVISCYQTFSQPLVNPLHKMILLVISVSLGLALSILITKLRLYREVQNNMVSLKEYITESILEARKNGNYTTLNQLLDSKYSVHTILAMSHYQESCFDFQELSKWVKLKEAMSYFKQHNFKESDLMDDEKMRDYLKSVYPEFLMALSKAI